MERLGISILGVSEMRWPDAGCCDINKHRVYYSGTSNNKYRHGVGMMVNRTTAECVTNFVPVSERIMMLQIDAWPAKINVLQVYAPTTDHKEEDVEEFYAQITELLRKIPKQDLTIVMGDFNAKVGKGSTGEHIGPWGLGERNERGELLSMFAEEHKLIVTNTFFQLPPRRLYTWKSPMDTEENMVRNQIDYILVNKRYRNAFSSVKTYPGADLQSDHNPLVGVFRVRMKKVPKRQKPKYDLRKLKNESTKKQVQTQINEQYKPSRDPDRIEEGLKQLCDITNTIKKELLRPEKQMRKSWMTTEILELMEQRRRNKNNPTIYNNLKKIVKNRIREAKQEEMKERCFEIEKYQERFDSFNVHKKVKELTRKVKSRPVIRLVSSDGQVIIDKREALERWKDYVEELFCDNRPNFSQPDTSAGPSILKEEVQVAIATLKEEKAPGPDGIQAEFIKLLEEKHVEWMTTVFNHIYNTGYIPQKWLKSEFIVIPKKPGAKECKDYRTISLMSHLLKLFLKIIHRRIYRLCENQMSPTQFGFRNAMGTREALFSVQVLFQRCRDMSCDVYACFIDYQKAFDRVQHQKMVEALQSIGLDGKDVRVIGNLYWSQEASVRIQGENTEPVRIQRGVRQGCVLSPLLFNIYSEYIFREAMENYEAGILLNGRRLNNIRYADDTVIFADSLEKLQELMERIMRVSQQYGLDINVDKTKLMIISKNKIPCDHLNINGNRIERVPTYKYLGTNINDRWDHSQEIRCRVEKARAVFNGMTGILKSHDLSMAIKIRLLRCYVFSVLYYGVESWTLTVATERKLEAFEMWLYRRMLRVSWTQKITNIEILRRMGKEKEVLSTVKRRKLQYLGHIMRNETRYQLLQCILQGKVQGRRGIGRRRISWLKNLRTWFGRSTSGLFRVAVNKVIIAQMVANIRNG